MHTATYDPTSHEYRDYANPGRDTVRDFYLQNHANQTHDFVLAKKADFLRLNRRTMTPWEAARLPQYAGRRFRSRHRPSTDRSPAANGGSDSLRRASGMDDPDRADP